MVAGSENRDDRQEVFGELSGWLLAVCIVKHRNHGSMTPEDVLDEVEPKPRKAISVGDHNFCEMASECELQYLQQSPPLEIEARADV